MGITTRFSRDGLITCGVSAAVAFGMVASVGIAIKASDVSANGDLGRGIGFAFLVIPYIGAKLVERYVVRKDMLAVYAGALAGCSVPFFMGRNPLGYSVGSVVGAVVAAMAALFVPDVLPKAVPPKVVDSKAVDRTPA